MTSIANKNGAVPAAHPRFRACLRALLPFTVILAAAAGTPARAQGPEQFYEPGPAAGHWSLEYNGQFGPAGDGERPHSVEIFGGLSDRISLGVEVEGERGDGQFSVEEIGVGGIVSLTGEDASVELALLVQAGVTTDGDFPQLETRLIAERTGGGWHALGNIIVRRADAEERGTALAYAVALHRIVSDDIELGFEVSGQAARLGGFSEGFQAAHYAGPSLSIGWDLGRERELEIGLKYLRRLDRSDQYKDTVRLVLTLEV